MIRLQKLGFFRKEGIWLLAERFNNYRLFHGGVCKTRTGYLRMADADGKMRIEKCGWKKNADNKKVRGKKRETRMAKKEKK